MKGSVKAERVGEVWVADFSTPEGSGRVEVSATAEEMKKRVEVEVGTLVDWTYIADYPGGATLEKIKRGDVDARPIVTYTGRF